MNHRTSWPASTGRGRGPHAAARLPRLATALFATISLGTLPVGGCATTSGARSDAALTDAKLLERNHALEALAAEVIKPCSGKGKPDDSGVIVVSARADGSLSQGAVQWHGGDEVKQCLATELAKTRLPPWPGPTVTWLWSVSSATHPAPGPTVEPADLKTRLDELIRQAQGNTGMGSDASVGPLSACAQRTLPPDVYARVMVRAFIFPDGKVVGATPVGGDGERDAGYMDCVVELVRGWQFSPLPGPGFFVLDVPLKYGINPLDR